MIFNVKRDQAEDSQQMASFILPENRQDMVNLSAAIVRDICSGSETNDSFVLYAQGIQNCPESHL